MRPFYFFTISCLRIFFKIFYRHRTYGLENLPKEGSYILAANHASFFDPPIIAASVPAEIAYMAHEYLFNGSWWFRWLIKSLNAYPISKEKTNLATLKIAIGMLKKGQSVVIFPEGKRTPDGTLQPFNRGVELLASKGKCPIVPVYIKGSYDIWPRDQKSPNWKGRCACYFGEPIYPNGDPKSITSILFKRIQQLEKISLS